MRRDDACRAEDIFVSLLLHYDTEHRRGISARESNLQSNSRPMISSGIRNRSVRSGMDGEEKMLANRLREYDIGIRVKVMKPMR